VFAVGWLSAATAFAKAPEWSMNATIIEACSCPMFCQCYFSTEPASHAGHGKFCKFNMAHKVNKGRHGNVKLDGAKFWIAGDLGDNFGDGEAEWAQVSFDPAVTKEQRDAIASILTHVYPVKWKSFTIGKDAPIDWKADDARAEARLDGGKSGELVLVRNPSANAKGPTVIKNLRYFGAPRNQGFVLMPNQVEAYRVGANKFEFKGTNGFMITYDISSKDVAAAQAGAAKGGTPH
jgi:hypothetical protein